MSWAISLNAVELVALSRNTVNSQIRRHIGRRLAVLQLFLTSPVCHHWITLYRQGPTICQTAHKCGILQYRLKTKCVDCGVYRLSIDWDYRLESMDGNGITIFAQRNWTLTKLKVRTVKLPQFFYWGVEKTEFSIYDDCAPLMTQIADTVYTRAQFPVDMHNKFEIVQLSLSAHSSRENQTLSQLQWAEGELNYFEFVLHVFWELGSRTCLRRRVLVCILTLLSLDCLWDW